MLPRSPLFWVVVILLVSGAFASKDPEGFKHFAHGVGNVIGLCMAGLFAILGAL